MGGAPTVGHSTRFGPATRGALVGWKISVFEGLVKAFIPKS